MRLTDQAERLNSIIGKENSSVLEQFAKKGLKSYFPKEGILAQAAEAKNCEINATVGVALEDTGHYVTLKNISDRLDLPNHEAFGYAPSFGVLELRKKWSELLNVKNPSLKNINHSLPVVTGALTHGIFVTATLFISEDEKVIAPDYFWGNYKLILENGVGAEIDSYPTFTDDGKYNFAGLSDKLSSGAVGNKKIILNFPNNPTGYTPLYEEVDELRSVLLKEANRGSRITVIIDDAYFGLVFKDGVFKESIFTVLADAHENILAVKVDGPTKEDYAWGFRVGFITYGIKGGTSELYSALEQKTAGVVRGSISNASALSQNLLLRAYNSDEYTAQKQDKYNLLKTRFEKVADVLASHPEFSEEFTPLPHNSGYFMCIKLREGLDAVKMREKLVEEGVGLIQVKNLLRVSFASTPTDRLEEVFLAIYKVAKSF